MKQASSLLGLIVLIVFFILANMSFYVIREGTQVIVTEFGKPIGEPVTTAGVNFKLPWRESRVIEKRILNWDGYPNQVPTKDKKFIEVDTTARWKIIDPLKFIQTVQNERGARSRLDAILDAVTRDVISSHDLVEVVRSSNEILEKQAQANAEDGDPRQGSAVQIPSVTMGRERLSNLVIERGKKELQELGIELIDVQFRRISYEESVEQKVYERMISERQRIAERIRSVGKGERALIDGKISRDLQQIQSEAYKTAEKIRGEAEARAIRVYASAMRAEPGLYKFLRTLEAYKKTMSKKTRFILSTDSEYLRLLKNY